MKVSSSGPYFFRLESLLLKDLFAGVAGLDPRFLVRGLMLGVRKVLVSWRRALPKDDTWLLELFLLVGVNLNSMFSFFTTGIGRYFYYVFLMMYTTDLESPTFEVYKQFLSTMMDVNVDPLSKLLNV